MHALIRTTRRRSAARGAAGLAVLCVAALTGVVATATTATAGTAAQTPTPTCTIVGTPRDDVLVGTRGDDVICGGGGIDTLRGGSGDDTVRGGSGDDTVRGGSGNDHIIGGPGSDTLSGGPGRDICVYDATDIARTSCQFDVAPPEIVSLTSTPGAVDVTRAPRVVTVRLHVRDDTRVRRPTGVPTTDQPWIMEAGVVSPDPTLALGRFRLTSGNAHDGVWSATVTVPRGFPAAELKAFGGVCDLSHQCTDGDGTPLLAVTDSAPDTALPAVSLLGPATPTTVLDVRRSSRTLVVRTRVRDADTGTSHVDVCLAQPTSNGAPETLWIPRRCKAATLVSGDRHDGVWRATVRVERGVLSTDSCVWVQAADRAQPLGGSTWSCAQTRDDRPFSGRRGYVSIVGRGDPAPPVVRTYHQSPSAGTATSGVVTVQLRATGVSAVVAVVVDLWSATSGLRVHEFLELTAGNEHDGTWTGTLHVDDLSPGTYYPVVTVADAVHVRSYVGASVAPGLNLPTLPLPGGDQPVTVTGA